MLHYLGSWWVDDLAMPLPLYSSHGYLPIHLSFSPSNCLILFFLELVVIWCSGVEGVLHWMMVERS